MGKNTCPLRTPLGVVASSADASDDASDDTSNDTSNDASNDASVVGPGGFSVARFPIIRQI